MFLPCPTTKNRVEVCCTFFFGFPPSPCSPSFAIHTPLSLSLSPVMGKSRATWKQGVTVTHLGTSWCDLGTAEGRGKKEGVRACFGGRAGVVVVWCPIV